MVKCANYEIIYLCISDLRSKEGFKKKSIILLRKKQEKRYEQDSGPLYPEPYTSVK